MRIEVKGDLDRLSARLNWIQRDQIPFAASKSLNELAFRIAKQTMPKKADDTFEGGATNFTKRGFGYKKSNKRDLTALVFVNPAQKEYMKFMIEGGVRFPKKRAILVSTTQSKLNKFGNFPRGTVSKMLGDKAKFFSGVPKGQPEKPAGIWERYGRGSKAGGQRIRIVALYTQDAQYKPLFPFGTFGDQVVFARSGGFADLFQKNLAQALATAR
jgi:hypothetical protein